MTQPGFVSLDMPAEMAYVDVPGACLGALLEGNDDLKTSESTVYGLQLAVHEVCTNIVTHAYGPAGRATLETSGWRIRITFTVAQQTGGLIIDFYDTGRSFDPAEVAQPDLAEPQTGGYGLYLVHQLVEEVLYESEPKGNHWRLTKHL